MFTTAHRRIVLGIVTPYRLYLSNAVQPEETHRRPETGSDSLQRLRKKTRHQSAKVDGSVANLLENIVGGRSPLKFPAGAKVFSQGEPANSMYFIRTGKVKVTVASARGKNAVLALLGLRDFFGEGCLVGRTPIRTSTATTLEPSAIYRIGKRAMLRAFHTEPEFAETFLTAVLARSVNLEEDLCDQIFNHSEKRLARVLLKLSRFSPHDKLANITLPSMNQETLAEIVGTTRSRINLFMTKFRKLGLIQYRKGNTEITIMAEALTNSVLHD
jgi:CRP/FNR family cyclic AMP-dependent transcriptional regulator